MAVEKLPNNFLKIRFNYIPNLTGGLSNKILLSWIWATWFSIKTLRTFLLDSYSCVFRILCVRTYPTYTAATESHYRIGHTCARAKQTIT